jgi:hypothetical protein
MKEEKKSEEYIYLFCSLYIGGNKFYASNEIEIGEKYLKIK